jgi:hypothetical protein
MRRYLLPAAAAVAVVGLLVSPAQALRIAVAPQPERMALTMPVVITGKVTSIEKDTVDAAPFINAPNKVAYKVAVVKIDKALVGAENLTHIKIGFIPPAALQPGVNPLPVPPVGGPVRPLPIRPGGFQMPELKVGQESLFFLAKHPTADFYTIPGGAAPIDLTTDAGKKQLADVNKVLAVVADPMKGLKSNKADVRLETATRLLMKYRSYPPFGGETDQVAIPAEESKLILKTLADADWKAAPPIIGGPAGGLGAPNAYQAFFQLNLTDKDGWKAPMFPRPMPGAPPVDFVGIYKETYVKWLAGPGKDYVVKKIVAKPAK